jgi:hypothetical protein
MPAANRFRNGAISNENRMHDCSEKTFDESRGGGIGADEIAQRSDHGAFPENRTLPEELSSGGGKPDPFPLQTFQCIQPGCQGGVKLLGA